MSHHEPYATLRIADDQRYLICLVNRFPTQEEFRQMVTQIAQTGTRNNLPQVLYDIRAMSQHYGMMDAHGFGESIAELLPSKFRVAMLVNEIFPNRKHLETVAVNRGLYLKYFTELDQALTWLLGSPSASTV